MPFASSTARATLAALLVACAAQVGVADAQTAAAPAWQTFLKRANIERVQISPNGMRIAVAQRAEGRTLITIRNAATMEVEKSFDPGEGGEIETLRWLDDERLLVAASAQSKKYGVALYDPVMAIIRRDGTDRYVLPASFMATIDGDPNHLLVSRCTNIGWTGCHDAVHKVEIGHTSRMGEAIVTAPDPDSGLYADRKGNVRFAASTDDKANTKLYARTVEQKDWTLVNDSEKSGLTVWPIGIDADGTSAFVLAERTSGPSVVERYEFATGKRTEVYRDAESDPVDYILAFDGLTPIGAYYGATSPRPVIWNPGNPDAAAIVPILQAFPGRSVDVTSTTATRDKAIVLTHGERDPGSWYLFDRKANSAALVARAKTWLKEDMLPTNREIVFDARDGMKLHGILTLPTTGPQRGLPMVVVPHGGPHGVYDETTYDTETALLASQGYAVLRVNFRGSGGYGKQFEESGWMQWGRAMQDDITDATKWVIGQGYADKDRVCIYGWSYGGYAALMGAAREPDLYRCAVGAAGPYDLQKMYRWGSIRRSDLGLDYLSKVIGKDKAVLAERSPNKQAAAIKVPVFIVHGRLDPRVDVAHARRMVDALEDAGVQVEFKEYMKAGHGLYLDEDEADFYTRLLAFLDKHTKAR
jgi:dipeptidyl aminopeptidase/acylaminoacyl peptidase